MIYTNNIDGIPLYFRQNLVVGDKAVPCAYAYAFYGKDGLIGMEGYGLYEKGLTEGSDAPLSVEKIMDVFLADMREPIFVPGRFAICRFCSEHAAACLTRTGSKRHLTFLFP